MQFHHHTPEGCHTTNAELYARMHATKENTMTTYQPTPEQVHIFGQVPTLAQRLDAARAFIRGEIGFHAIWYALNYTPHVRRVHTIRYLESLRAQ